MLPKYSFPAYLWNLIVLEFLGTLKKFLQEMASFIGFFAGLIFFSYFYFLGKLRYQMIGDLKSLIENYGSQSCLILLLLIALRGTSGNVFFLRPSEVDFLIYRPISENQLLSYRMVRSAFRTFIISFFPCLLVVNSVESFLEWYFQAVSFAIPSLFLIYLISSLCSRLPELLVRSIHLMILSLLVTLGFGAGFWGFFILLKLQIPNAFSTLQTFYLKNILTHWLTGYQKISNPENFLILVGGSSFLSVLFYLLALRFSKVDSEDIYLQSIENKEKLEAMKSGRFFIQLNPLKSIKVPVFPFLHGIGPFVWRRTQEAIRKFQNTIGVTVAILTLSFFSVRNLLETGQQNWGGFAGLEILLAHQWFLLFLAMTSAILNFKSDIQSLGFLKSLPVSTFQLVMGQSLASILYLMAISFFNLAMDYLLFCYYFPNKNLLGLFLKSCFWIPALCSTYVHFFSALFLLFPGGQDSKRSFALGILQFVGVFTGVIFLMMAIVFTHLLGLYAARTFGTGVGGYLSYSTLLFYLLAFSAFGLSVWSYRRSE